MYDADLILDLLEDGTWREVEEISREARLPPERLDVILKFLAEFGFIDLREEERKVRLTQPTRRWLVEIK